MALAALKVTEGQLTFSAARARPEAEDGLRSRPEAEAKQPWPLPRPKAAQGGLGRTEGHWRLFPWDLG